MSTGRTNYAESFSRWSLHDCSGVEDALSEVMRVWFARWRTTRGKLVTETHSVTRQSLDQAWTAFVSRWNAETGPRFCQLIESREATPERLSVGALAMKICDLSWNAERTCCYVHYLEGCSCCHGNNLPRPFEDERLRFLNEAPLSPTEERWIGWYRTAVYEARRGSLPRPLKDPSRTHRHNRGHHPLGTTGAPSYPPSDQASERGIDDAQEYHRRVADQRDPNDVQTGRRGDRHDEGLSPQYGAGCQRYPRVEQDRRAGTEGRDRWEDAAIAQRLDRMARRLEQLDQDNYEHRRWMHQEQVRRYAPPREEHWPSQGMVGGR
ncbi:hypothetical protein PI124_g8085 [Phytophthora idaei]|nr:hypothetical protein PI125_g10376 [Phytophthora idaei]KAG3148784.1 hypothetical protein PI126_g12325 [Phytophthora idaei]KAG3247222.1 hypothetical protein PI124_g8085 [Phytophthora idaei]